jgi:hypothetical protein
MSSQPLPQTQGFRDFVVHFEKLSEWQHMCAACADRPEEVARWKNIRTSLIEYHKIYQPWLLGDMLRRSPGRAASSDGTFRLVLRTKTDGKVRHVLCSNPHPLSWHHRDLAH